ncbi:hypothetical protein BV898_11572 [Hypsibius exemplaris]|uniref:Uncharacterized protein n=1 Tax=Hypsibius exemplaris TaxID=2072580 RepID=A0A1W0WGA4_HYPEX|nr:hypothetical protein BV898_11572 [Hypsibius exemplaris]
MRVTIVLMVRRRSDGGSVDGLIEGLSRVRWRFRRGSVEGPMEVPMEIPSRVRWRVRRGSDGGSVEGPMEVQSRKCPCPTPQQGSAIYIRVS